MSRRPPAARLLLLLIALLLAGPRAALAHGALRRAVPARGARLTTAPRELRLTFSERADLAGTQVVLLGPDGAGVALAPIARAPDSGHVVVAPIRGPLAAGVYTVAWQFVGDDGHPVRGRYTFTLAAGAAGLAATAADAGTPPPSPATGGAAAGVTAPGQAPPTTAHHPAAPTLATSVPGEGDFGAESPGYVAIRGLTYLALLCVIGSVAFRVAVLGMLRRHPPHGADGRGLDDALAAELVPAAARRAATLGLAGAVALVAVAAARLYAQSLALHGAAGVTDPTLVGTLLRSTVWGWGWLLQVAAALLATVGFALARRPAREASIRRGPDADARGGWALAGLASLTLAVTPALSGHAAAAPRFAPLVVAADALHVLGAGGWLGSLLVLVVAGLPTARALADPAGTGRHGRAVAALVHAFSPLALGFAGLLTVTGLLATWVHVGTVPALWGTAYGRTLLLKLGMLGVVAGAGAYNWRRVRPALDDPTDAGRGVARLRRSSAVELAAGVAVLVVTAVLVATPMPADASDVQAGNATAPHGASPQHAGR